MYIQFAELLVRRFRAITSQEIFRFGSLLFYQSVSPLLHFLSRVLPTLLSLSLGVLPGAAALAVGAGTGGNAGKA